MIEFFFFLLFFHVMSMSRPAEGGGGVAHREDLAATASATLERSTGTVAHGQERAARERRRRRSIEVSRITTYLLASVQWKIANPHSGSECGLRRATEV
jgi:hypothetical protein